jgi:hypothetical protein
MLWVTLSQRYTQAMINFDYSAPAELFAAHGRAGLRYRRFSKAAEAIRYAVENDQAGSRRATWRAQGRVEARPVPAELPALRMLSISHARPPIRIPREPYRRVALSHSLQRARQF